MIDFVWEPGFPEINMSLDNVVLHLFYIIEIVDPFITPEKSLVTFSTLRCNTVHVWFV